MIGYPFGFRILGPCTGERRIIDWQSAFNAYAACDDRAELQTESYLSAFCFSREFREHLAPHRTTKGYHGFCWAPWLWFDIDAPGSLENAKESARRLCVAIIDEYGINEDDLLVFFSGSKGFHVGIPTTIWQPEPSENFNQTARTFAEKIAQSTGISIDSAIYDQVRAFRAPNSKHPKTGKYKRRISVEELMALKIDAILAMAEDPAPFDVPKPTGRSEKADADWRDAAEQVHCESEERKHRHNRNNSSSSLNRLTLEFIKDGAEEGERGMRLFSAAANLAEFDCPTGLAHALLTEAGLDSGLPSSEVRRHIDGGMNHKGGES